MSFFDGLQSFAQWVFVNSLKASILIALIFMIQWFVRDRLPAKWQHALWLILIVRLLLPAGFESNLSLYNVLNKSDRAREISARVFTHPMRVVARHERARGHDLVALFLEEGQEGRSDVVQGLHG